MSRVSGHRRPSVPARRCCRHRSRILGSALACLAAWALAGCATTAPAEPAPVTAPTGVGPGTLGTARTDDAGTGTGTGTGTTATASPAEPASSGTGTTGPPAPATAAPPTAAPATAAPATVRTAQHTYRDEARARDLLVTVYWPPRSAPDTVVLIAHGYRLPGWGYERLARQIAAAGYVVGVPDFPHTSGVVGDGNRADIVNQPADLSFVADRIIERRLPDAGPAPWPTLDASAQLVIAGHSDGGLTATAFAYNDRYRDPRVVGCISLTGGIALFPGAYFTPRADGRAQPPLLAAHGPTDETNPYRASENLFAAHPGGTGSAPAKHLVTIEGGSHLGPYMFDTASSELGEVLVAFVAGATARAPQPQPLSVAGSTLLTLRSG